MIVFAEVFDMDNTLTQERQTYRAHLDELLRDSENQYVVIKADRVIGVFASEEEAIQEGNARLGRTDFLVKRIVPDKPASFDWEAETQRVLDEHSEAWRRLAGQ